MLIERSAGATLTALEIDIGDEVRFALASGATHAIKVISVYAGPGLGETVRRVREAGDPVHAYRFGCTVEIDGSSVTMNRYVPSPASFYEPWVLSGMRIWLDAVSDIFDFLEEKHGQCMPSKRVRLAIQDASLRICPVLLHPWCPLPEGGLKIESCYRGEDCWMGPYDGRDAHGGLDINHPAGTPLWTPIAIDNHELFSSLAAGDNNNRWRGVHRWPDGSEWVLQSHHLIRLLVPLDKSIPAGTHYAEAAGVHVGTHEHSHFVFKVRDRGEEIVLDPWILFWQMYEDRKLTRQC